jgi:glycosyltransferase involved in cell wall biosynthesis
MKVALVRPPIAGHGSRGVGFYGQRLFEALQKIVNVSWLDFSLDPFQNFDIVHYPYFDLFWPTLPPIRSYKTVVTLHDLTPLKFPDRFPLGIRAKIIWPWQKFLLQHVNAVLTDSKTSQWDIKNITGVDSFVTYLAADPIFKPLNLKRSNFALYVGGGNWNKNVISLIYACKKIKQKLILVGKEFLQRPATNIETEPLLEIQKYIDGRNVVALGFVPTGELVKLYNQARAYVQPSVYEGFGLPVLEAMACGTPVVCGKNSSLVEIGGDAVTYADVTNIDGLAENIEKVKTTGKEVEQSKKFSWEKCARETYEVYKKI